MKLIRFGLPGEEKPGVATAAGMFDVSAFGEDFGEKFFETNGLARLSEWYGAHAAECPQVPAGTRLGSPILRPSKIICIGLNYADHARETNAAIPAEPIVFFKSTSALVGPNDDLVIPRNSQKTDWEVELAVVIGKKASYVEEKDALDYVAGYCLHNDYSERAFQIERGGQWVKGKSCDTFAPLGPWLATKDEIADVNNLRLWLTVNGQKMQDGNTSNFIFNVAYVVAYLSQFMTLLPGDVISTGTPAGVGLGMNPQVFLKTGDVIELGIDGLGTSKQTAVAYK
ncbi:2-keto-4-pentenoate hydratase/2-oxohepta-3-ene-1,7-dioic acid hydratase (catechol pathway) [Chitinophaga ginsengisegetis]|uniref:2-keto-4-pentenoate hydratase/2-oxohepta-3-ene-1,7-dioic acid hydratase (Catechol pathway) n=1 Tax=Chitinophaga ginsengisegetis TaxID=393003 RepID=A0A1T5NI74_9BACT|nr:fumarylacetoacetate hydrolase family protein [Chitinophaga ginsengisegetis]SKD00106.1 2-keto-4-pentenoate hydratase/2-oxohepta-3-ene-1,7-dioic acid hydratase (catechol pathway) [Chitinophaga ginsengisegetis]